MRSDHLIEPGGLAWTPRRVVVVACPGDTWRAGAAVISAFPAHNSPRPSMNANFIENDNGVFFRQVPYFVKCKRLSIVAH